jgi:DNA polymerase (family X)
MVEKAGSLGYEYIALTDHSRSARVVHGLDLGRLEEKVEELEAVRKKRERRKPQILLGAEVDILSDGKLDYPDEVLSRLEVVIASLHGAFRQSKDRMTGRSLDAIANPYVHVIGHPTTRLIGSREPVEFDFERIVKAAVEAGVALEVNGQPNRLDLTDAMAHAAVEGGALLAIDSDAHSSAQLEQIRYGVFQARRGWVKSDRWSTLGRGRSSTAGCAAARRIARSTSPCCFASPSFGPASGTINATSRRSRCNPPASRITGLS